MKLLIITNHGAYASLDGATELDLNLLCDMVQKNQDGSYFKMNTDGGNQTMFPISVLRESIISLCKERDNIAPIS